MYHSRISYVISRVFKAFAYRDFRIMWFGACTSSIGTLMQTFAQAWLVLQLSKSSFLLGLDSFLGSIPDRSVFAGGRRVRRSHRAPEAAAWIAICSDGLRVPAGRSCSPPAW